MVPWARYKVYIVLKNNQLSEQYKRTICLYSHMMCIQVNCYKKSIYMADSCLFILDFSSNSMKC